MNGAELIGMAKDIGTIEAGKFADIIAVKADPLRNISAMEQVAFVMKGGAVIKHGVNPRPNEMLELPALQPVPSAPGSK
jgi:imidazolonepropionase-like amidohydrolase